MARRKKAGPPKSLRQSMVDAVLGGASTVDEVLSVVGRTITASQACLACRRNDKSDAARVAKGTRRPMSRKRTSQEAAALGRKQLVSEQLGRLARDGVIARLSRGVFGPIQPKLYQPGQTA